MDKPTMKFSLTIPDTDALRAMILRDHVEIFARIETNGTAQVMCRDRGMAEDLKRLQAEASEHQRRIMQVERLADIFSVTLPKR